MNKYLASVIENVKKKHANEPEFVQTVEEVLSSSALSGKTTREKSTRISVIAVSSTEQSGPTKATFVSNRTYIPVSLSSSVSNRFSKML